MHVESFKLKHLDQIESVAGEAMSMVYGPIRDAELNGNMMAFTLIHECKIIAIGGVHHLWGKVGDAFSVMSENAYKYPKSLFKGFVQNLNALINVGKYERIQMMVKADFEAGIRFAERLGFEREGLMRKWSHDGKDYYLYARVK